LPSNIEGLVHISEIANEYVTDIANYVAVGDTVKVKVLGENKQKKLDLSMKQADGNAAPSAPTGARKPRPSSAPAPSRKKPEAADSGNQSSFKSIGRYRRPTDDMSGFDLRINSFLKNSEEKLIDLKRNIQGKQGIVKRKRKKS
jgi:S1 RNA binding domain protein